MMKPNIERRAYRVIGDYYVHGIMHADAKEVLED